MKQSGKCNEISLATTSLFTEQRDYYLDALNEASDKLLSLMKSEVQQTVWGNGPGKPEWRTMVMEKLSVVHQEVTDSYLETGVGFPSTAVLADLIKAMVIAYGAGSAAGNDPIKAGPPGRWVWDENIDEEKESQAETEYYLPPKFNQEGNHFIENSIKLMRKHFDDVQDVARANLPDWYFYHNVIVKPR